MKQIIIGTAGHIDHGKTSIVKKLTGVNTDVLTNEIARGMTIDLGFAFMSNEITIIDVPGHEKFIRNMVAGVNSIDIGLLVVSADDGIMPQTKEHFDILSYLKIPYGIVALNKIDLVDDEDWLNLIEHDIRRLLKNSFMENAPIIRVSTKNNFGIEKLKKNINLISKQNFNKKDRGFFRLPVDRAFSLKGFGTIATGSVSSGKITVGKNIQILPVGVQSKIRGMQTHKKEVKTIKIGERVAINLSNIDKENIKRGSQIIEEGYVKNSQLFLAEITLNKKNKRFIKNNQRLRIHINTDEVLCRVQLINKSKKILAGETNKVLIKLEKEIPIIIDDLFILRFYSPQETIGGGKVLITIPQNEKKIYFKNLKTIHSSNKDNRLKMLFTLYKNNPKKISEWIKIWNMSSNKIKELFNQFDSVYFGSEENNYVTLNSEIQNQQKEYLDYLSINLENNKNQKYFSKAEVFKNLNYNESLFNYITSILVKKNKIKIKNGKITLFNYKLNLNPQDEKNLKKLNLIIKSYNFSPPEIKILSKEIDVDFKKLVDLLFVLLDQGSVVRITNDIWINNNKIEELKNKIKLKYQNNLEFTVSDIKEMAGISRKYAIPILEFFDKQNFTIRLNNVRKLK
tara:strand:- start:17815 stop:19689 length:1875 start_codon:yes stop_codon:yes gene_type:complete